MGVESPLIITGTSNICFQGLSRIFSTFFHVFLQISHSMHTIIENLTPQKRGWFGIVFRGQSAIESFLAEAQTDQRIFLTISVNEVPSEIDLKEARQVLEMGQTVYKMYQMGAEFSVPLHYEKLELSDGHTLDLDLAVGLRMAKPLRFFHQNKGRTIGGKLTDELLSSVWSRAFRAPILALTRSISAPEFSAMLTDRAIFRAIQAAFCESSLEETVMGTELMDVRAVSACSLSYEKRLEQEMEQAQREMDQKAKEEERMILCERQRVLEIELQQQKEKRRIKELETNAQIELKRLENEQKDRARQELLRYEEIYKNRWPSLSKAEKLLAGQMSDFFRDLVRTRPISIVLPASQRKKLEIDESPALLNVLAQGASLAFSITAPQDGFVTILNLGTSGRLTVLVPNSMTGSDAAEVHAVKGKTLKFPQTFLPSLAPDIFEELSESGLEGIYCLITPDPLIPVARANRLDDLQTIDYSRVSNLIDVIKALPPDAFSVGVLEFKVLPKQAMIHSERYGETWD